MNCLVSWLFPAGDSFTPLKGALLFLAIATLLAILVVCAIEGVIRSRDIRRREKRDEHQSPRFQAREE